MTVAGPGVPEPPVTPTGFALDPPRATKARVSMPRRAARAMRTVLHLFEGLATTVVVFPWLSADSRRHRVRRWSSRLLRMLAVEVRMVGALHEGGNVLIVANHVSWLDIFVLNSVQPMRFIAKSELARWPLLGRLVRDVGTLFVERSRRHDAHRVTIEAHEALASGDVVAIFPEGTTTDGTRLLPFKSSLLQPIVNAQGAVQPVAMRYRAPDGSLSTAAAYAGDTTFLASFWRICGERRIGVDVILPPALPVQRRHRRELASSAEAAIREALGLPAPGKTGSERGKMGS
ncbi:MAG: 1-acyl-sn-glycerol-3-phosphate acyltransferase, partial [Betaproteobacteria bacterium]|nr:1-acyl-sn-glycerol-3-phosphate acyltransferase [Betaproteobacteria bacterium]